MAEQNSDFSTEDSLPPCSFSADGTDGASGHPAIQPSPQDGIIGRVDRFELIQEIGRGGMGVVYLARDPQQADPVAVKLLRPELSQHRRTQEFFLKEARHGTQLKHPNILPVLEFSSSPAYLVMPYRECGSLSALLKSQRLLPPERITKMARQIAAALFYAHKRGLIHRDLKPSNILVDGQDHVWVADFGLALSLANDSLIDAQNKSVEGTPNYMSPSVAAGEMEDTRCDIYSFGTVLYELLAGQPPYHGVPAKEILQKVKECPPVPILTLNPQAPPSLVRIAEKAMARELSERYVHMRYVEEDLRQIMEGPSPLNPETATPSNKAAVTTRFGGTMGLYLGVGLAVVAGWFGIVLFSPDQGSPASPPSPASVLSDSFGLRILRTIERPDVMDWGRISLIKLYPVGPPVMALPMDNRVSMISLKGEVLVDFKAPDPFAKDLKIFDQTDVNQDQINEFLAGWAAGSNVFVSIHGGVGRELKRFQTKGSINTKMPGLVPESGINGIQFKDINGDGRPEIIALTTGGYVGGTRGVCVWDYESGRELWRYETAPGTITLDLVDFTGDGKSELVVGSAADGNGRVLPDGTDDTNSFVYCVDCNGHLLWRTLIGDYLSHAFPKIIDMDGDGRLEILVWQRTDSEMPSEAELKDLPRVVRLDASGQITHRFGGTGIDLVKCVIGDLDSDNKQEVLAGDTQGRLYCLNADLSVRQELRLAEKRFYDVKLRPHAVADLDLDGTMEIILTSQQMEIISGMNPGKADQGPNQRVSHDNDVIVLDAALRRRATLRLSDTFEKVHTTAVFLVDINNDKRTEILVLWDKAYVISCRGLPEPK